MGDNGDGDLFQKSNFLEEKRKTFLTKTSSESNNFGNNFEILFRVFIIKYKVGKTTTRKSEIQL